MEINIRQIFLILLKKAHVIVVCALIAAVFSFLYTNYMITPLYSSSAMLSIQASENREDYKSVTTADYTVSVELVSTITELIKNEACLNIVGEITGLNKYYSPQALKSMISISSKETENFYITVSAPYPEHSLILVNAFADVLSDSSFVRGNIVNADDKDPNRGYIKKILKAGTVTLISGAKNVPLTPSSPNIAKNTFLGLLVGALIASLFYIFKDFVSTKVLTEEDIENLIPDLISLGSIPLITPSKGSEQN